MSNRESVIEIAKKLGKIRVRGGWYEVGEKKYRSAEIPDKVLQSIEDEIRQSL